VGIFKFIFKSEAIDQILTSKVIKYNLKLLLLSILEYHGVVRKHRNFNIAVLPSFKSV